MHDGVAVAAGPVAARAGPRAGQVGRRRNARCALALGATARALPLADLAGPRALDRLAPADFAGLVAGGADADRHLVAQPATRGAGLGPGAFPPAGHADLGGTAAAGGADPEARQGA